VAGTITAAFAFKNTALKEPYYELETSTNGQAAPCWCRDKRSMDA